MAFKVSSDKNQEKHLRMTLKRAIGVLDTGAQDEEERVLQFFNCFFEIVKSEVSDDVFRMWLSKAFKLDKEKNKDWPIG